MKTAIVTTTINLPVALESYTANLKNNGYTADVEFIVVGDNKSPAATGDYLAKLAKDTGYEIEWWDVARQKAWLKDQPELDALLPWNSVQRRNIAYLRAVERGADVIITIDDDNYATDDDYLGGHGIVGRTIDLPVVSSSTSWFNSSSLLVTEPSKPLFHRGFPTCKRGPGEVLERGRHEARVVVNAGLWLDVADADAMGHLDVPCEVLGFRDGFDGRLAVAHGTNMVFNSQNTAFLRDTLPAMFLMPMGAKCGELEVGRYDDIWMGIFLKVIADHLGDLVCVGVPLVKQMRNEHDLLKDALVEIPAQRITNTMTLSLPRVKLTASDYHGCYLELVDQLEAALTVEPYTPAERDYLTEMYRQMRVWAKISQSYLGAASGK